MTSLQQAPQPPQFTRPAKPPLPAWTLCVSRIDEIAPHTRRLVFDLDGEGDFTYRPGQDLVLLVPDASGQPVRRHYTIRAADQATLAIDFVLHGHGGPGEAWARDAAPGDRLEARGPRGRTVLNADADWHLFIGDETCLPAIFAMLEELPAAARAFAFIEVETCDDRLYLDADCDLDLEWLVRKGPAVPASLGLIERAALFAPPPGRGQAYVIGETSTVRTIRQGLLARGLDKSQITAEGYWRPGREGGHDHIFDLG